MVALSISLYWCSSEKWAMAKALQVTSSSKRSLRRLKVSSLNLWPFKQVKAWLLSLKECISKPSKTFLSLTLQDLTIQIRQDLIVKLSSTWRMSCMRRICFGVELHLSYSVSWCLPLEGLILQPSSSWVRCYKSSLYLIQTVERMDPRFWCYSLISVLMKPQMGLEISLMMRKRRRLRIHKRRKMFLMSQWALIHSQKSLEMILLWSWWRINQFRANTMPKKSLTNVFRLKISLHSRM